MLHLSKLQDRVILGLRDRPWELTLYDLITVAQLIDVQHISPGPP